MSPLNPLRFLTAAFSLTCCLLPLSTRAFQVYSPEVDAGEAEIALQSDVQRDGGNRQQLELGYGMSPHWFTGLYGVWRQAPQQARRFDAVKWENILLPSGNERRAVPWGLYLELEQPATAGATEVEIKGLFQKRQGRWEHLANLIAGREVEGAAAADLTTGYAWRSACSLAHGQLALEGYGRLGRLNGHGWHPDPQHRWGPVLRYRQGEAKIEVGYLLNLSQSRTIDTWKLNLEWAF